jgi:hypothetical protein
MIANKPLFAYASRTGPAIGVSEAIGRTLAESGQFVGEQGVQYSDIYNISTAGSRCLHNCSIYFSTEWKKKQLPRRTYDARPIPPALE